MVLNSATRYILDLVLLLTALTSFLAATAHGFVLSTIPNSVSREQHTYTNLSTQRCSGMAEPDVDMPLLLISRLAHYGLGEEAKAKLVLVSQSPRRREILDMMLLHGRYTAETPPLDETKLQQDLSSTDIMAVEYTRKLAEAKAFSLAERHRADGKTNEAVPTIYLGSDTIVELDNCILEKPRDSEDAKRMLTMLSGRRHQVHTGVALYRLLGEDIALAASFTDTAVVTFASLSQKTIDAYVATGEPLDKAGMFITAKSRSRQMIILTSFFASCLTMNSSYIRLQIGSYGIQGVGGQLVTGITGDFFTVMGLPMHKTSNALALALDYETHTLP